MKTIIDTTTNHGFYQVMTRLQENRVWETGMAASESQVQRALSAQSATMEDFLALISPAGEKYLEAIAHQAQEITRQQFGRIIELFVPLYLANLCTNHCVYCGFSSRHRILRQKLTLAEVEEEALAIKATGVRNVLALTGDAHRKTGPDYLTACIQVLAQHFSSVGIEVPAMTSAEYRQVIKAGASSITLFQETYHESLYARLHPAGPKRNFMFRLDALERAAEAGIRSVNFGALLGLDDWRRDVFFMAMHAAFLQQRFPALAISFSLPRLRPYGDNKNNSVLIPKTVTDKNLVQAMLALRFFLPQAGITLSSRESPTLRDRLIPLGITRISAGVSTTVGGYAEQAQAHEKTPQFVISDNRSVQQMVQTIKKLGYQPVYSDWLLPGRGISDLPPALIKTLEPVHDLDECCSDRTKMTGKTEFIDQQCVF